MNPYLHTDPPRGEAPSTADRRAPDAPAAWAYMVRCGDGSLYSGWTNDLARRLRSHAGGTGARYTRMKGGAKLAYAERCADKSAALRREAALKKLSRGEKAALADAWAADHKITVRLADESDAAAVVELYNWYVTHSTATFQYDPSTLEEMQQNIRGVLARAPFLVAEDAKGRLCGYACAHPLHPRAAYGWCVETTIYCHPHCMGQGVGGKLYRPLLAMLKAQGYRAAAALVTHPNPESEAFHKALGFHKAGVQPRSGYKFGRWLDVQTWWLDLCATPNEDEPAPVRLGLTPEEVRAILEQYK